MQIMKLMSSSNNKQAVRVRNAAKNIAVIIQPEFESTRTSGQAMPPEKAQEEHNNRNSLLPIDPRGCFLESQAVEPGIRSPSRYASQFHRLTP